MWAFVKFCACPSFSFGIEGRAWVVIVLIPDQCLSIYVTSSSTSEINQKTPIRTINLSICQQISSCLTFEKRLHSNVFRKGQYFEIKIASCNHLEVANTFTNKKQSRPNSIGQSVSKISRMSQVGFHITRLSFCPYYMHQVAFWRLRNVQDLQ